MSARRLLQALLLVQAAAALAIGYAALRLFGVGSVWAAGALGLAAVLLVRLLINANNFLLSGRMGSPTPERFRLGAAGGLRLFGEEFSASMRASSWSMPRARARQRIHPEAPGPHVPPVLLLHGYGCNSGYWDRLAALLDGARISHATLDLEPIAADIDAYAPLVQRAAEDLCAATGAPQLVVVAHSMGGLVARAWMRAYGSARVARLVTLGTPHFGTSLARFGIGRNAAQMARARAPAADPCAAAPGNDWLRALADSESAQTRALITSIFTHHDNIVAPQTSSRLPGARNIEFGGVGHVALGSNPRILAQVMDELAALAAPGKAP